MFEIIFSNEAIRHLDDLIARDRVIVIASIEVNLKHEPLRTSKNRKLMVPNKISTWELRVGNFRVYYSVDELPNPMVTVHAIGNKIHNRVFIGGEEIEL